MPRNFEDDLKRQLRRMHCALRGRDEAEDMGPRGRLVVWMVWRQRREEGVGRWTYLRRKGKARRQNVPITHFIVTTLEQICHDVST